MAEVDSSPVRSTRFRTARFPGVVTGVRTGVSAPNAAPVATDGSSGSDSERPVARATDRNTVGSGGMDLGGPTGPAQSNVGQDDTGETSNANSNASAPAGARSAGGFALGNFGLSGANVGRGVGSLAGSLAFGPIGGLVGGLLGTAIGAQFDTPSDPGVGTYGTRSDVGPTGVQGDFNLAGTPTSMAESTDLEGNDIGLGDMAIGDSAQGTEGSVGVGGWASGGLSGVGSDPGGEGLDSGSDAGGGWGYGGGDGGFGGDGGGGDGGGGGGGGGWVICTHFKDTGMMALGLYRNTVVELRNMNPVTLRGYQFWATPVVRRMRRNPNARRFKLYAKLARARAQYLAHKHNDKKPDSILGRIVSALLIPPSYVIGLFVSETDWRTLYEGAAGRV